MIISTEEVKYKLTPMSSLIFPIDIPIDLSKYSTKNFNSKCDTLIHNISEEYARSKISNCTTIVFEVTQECNFRCRYCAYSDLYPNFRRHQNSDMSFLVAKSALDEIAKIVFSGLRTNKGSIAIGFYGGEPLIRFDLIKKIYEYSKLKKDEFGQEHPWRYRLTTNGYLLKGEIVDFFIENNFSCDISIDGHKSEHDKFRVTRNGEPTWEQIWRNINYIHDNFPEYFNEKINFQVTIHPEYNLFKLQEFFRKNENIFNKKNTRLSTLRMLGLQDCLQQIWEKKYRKLQNTVSKLDKNFWLFDKLNFNRIENKLIKKTSAKKFVNQFSGNCFPGENKLLVNSDGKFSICERVSPGNYIGDFDKGFYFNKIIELEKNWKQTIHNKLCRKCYYWFYCNACYSNSEKNGIFTIDNNFCENVKKSLYGDLTKYLSIEEEKREKNSDITNCLTDFIDKL